MHNFKKLAIWRKAFELSKLIYEATSTFPREEVYGLTSQIRRSSVSIASNIAEGSGRGTDKEFNRFLEIALSSSFELETQLLLSKELDLIKEERFTEIESGLQELQKMIFGFKKTLLTEASQAADL